MSITGKNTTLQNFIYRKQQWKCSTVRYSYYINTNIIIILRCHFNMSSQSELIYKLSSTFANIIIKYHFLINKAFLHILSHDTHHSTLIKSYLHHFSEKRNWVLKTYNYLSYTHTARKLGSKWDFSTLRMVPIL